MANDSAVIWPEVSFNRGIEIPTVEISVTRNTERSREPTLLRVGERDILEIELRADVRDLTVKDANVFDRIGRYLERVPLETILCCGAVSADLSPKRVNYLRIYVAISRVVPSCPASRRESILESLTPPEVTLAPVKTPRARRSCTFITNVSSIIKT